MESGRTSEMSGQKPNWGVVSTRDRSPSQVENHFDGEMGSKIETLKKRWKSEHPENCPYEEYSVVNREGDRIYVGLYPEGAVIRLNDRPEQVVFLTTEMMTELLKKLKP